MPEDFLGLEPETVAAAGQRTAATAGEWSAWASRVGGAMRAAATSANDTVVTSMIEDHLATLNPWLHQLAANTEALGTNATSASNVVAGADQTGAELLGREHAAAHTATTHLSRPVNTGGLAGVGPR